MQESVHTRNKSKQHDLGKNTANEIPMRETDGKEKSNKCYIPVPFFILSRKPFDETFENPKWRKAKQMQQV